MAMLIDFHSHFFSRTFFETLAAASPQKGSAAERVRDVAARVGFEIPAPEPEDHADRWLGEMDRHGVDHLVTFASVPQEAEAVRRAIAHSGGRMSGFIAVDPTQPDAVSFVRKNLGPDGFKGVLFFPALHGYDLGGSQFARVLDVLEEQGATATVHCGMLRIALRDHFGLPHSYDIARANPMALIPAADAHPGMRFVIPHFGAGFFRETLITGAQCPNVLVDTSSSNNWIDTQPERLELADVFERALGVFGTKRILFGTDSSVFPRGWRRDVFLVQREALGACGLAPRDVEEVLGRNAASLLGLQAPSAVPGESPPGQFSIG